MKFNIDTLKTILAVIPYFKSNTAIMNNAKETMNLVHVDKIKDLREKEYIDYIKKMIQYIEDDMSFENETLIQMSTSNENEAIDIISRHNSMSEEMKEWARQLFDLLASRGEIINGSTRLLSALERVENSPNYKLLDNMNELSNTVERIIYSIDQKTTKKESRSVIFGKNVSGMSSVIDQLRYEEKNALSCGIPAIDELVGKYRPKKLYCNIALAGGFKSGFLENITMGMKKANPNVEKLEGLENAILHITFENDLLQVFKRFIDYSHEEKFFSKKYLKNMSDEDITKMAIECLAPKNDSEMTIIVQQYPRYAIAPNDVTKIVADLKRDGYRVVATVIDYGDLMAAPPFVEGDIEDKSKMPLVRKFEHLKLLAQRINCPVITVGQFNRQGEAEAKQARTRYASPLMGGLNASHVAGGYGLKYHVESMILQYRSKYNGVNMLHLLMEKDRDGNVEEEEKKDEQAGKILRFIKFEDNGFKISSKPEDVYNDIRDVVPLDDGGIMASVFKSTNVAEELSKKMEEKAKSNKEILDQLK